MEATFATEESIGDEAVEAAVRAVGIFGKIGKAITVEADSFMLEASHSCDGIHIAACSGVDFKHIPVFFTQDIVFLFAGQLSLPGRGASRAVIQSA